MEDQKLLTKKEIIPIVILVAMIVVATFFYDKMPQRVPSHWNFQGDIDGYMSKKSFVLFFPTLSVAIYSFMTFLPFVDPLKKNVQKFANVYLWMKTIIVGFLSFLFFLIIYISVSEKLFFPVGLAVTLSIGIMMVLLGMVMPLIKKNYFIGIRTPWTIESEEVWSITHKRAKFAFVIGGAIMILGGIFEAITFWFFLVAILTLLWPVIDSYFIYRKIAKRDRADY